MNSAIERLLRLRVADVMSSQVIEISPHQTMAEAAALLRKHDISGAPVVDELGHCVGMLTATDFVVETLPHSDEQDASTNIPAMSSGDERPFCVDTLNEPVVNDYMAVAVQSIDQETSLIDAARAMCATHIHRLPVLDARGHVLGLISSLDVVAAMINAIEE